MTVLPFLLVLLLVSLAGIETTVRKYRRGVPPTYQTGGHHIDVTPDATGTALLFVRGTRYVLHVHGQPVSQPGIIESFWLNLRELAAGVL